MQHLRTIPWAGSGAVCRGTRDQEMGSWYEGGECWGLGGACAVGALEAVELAWAGQLGHLRKLLAAP